MTEYQTHAALVATLETEIVRLRAVNAELRKSIQAPVHPGTKLVQAARQALEALEAAVSDDLPYIARSKEAITALREALEALPTDSNHRAFRLGYAKGMDDAERRAKARGKPDAEVGQEPAAWRNAIPGGRRTDKWESVRVADYNQGWNDYRKATTAALEKLHYTAPQPAAPTQDPAAWAITYDGRTPHTLWHEGDGPLLDLEIKRQGGSAQKMALYTAPHPARQPLTDKRVKVKLGSQYGSDLSGHWFYLHPADEYAEAVLDKRIHGIGGEA